MIAQLLTRIRHAYLRKTNQWFIHHDQSSINGLWYVQVSLLTGPTPLEYLFSSWTKRVTRPKPTRMSRTWMYVSHSPMAHQTVVAEFVAVINNIQTIQDAVGRLYAMGFNNEPIYEECGSLIEWSPTIGEIRLSTVRASDD